MVKFDQSGVTAVISQHQLILVSNNIKKAADDVSFQAFNLPEWTWRAARSSSPAAGWPCSGSCCSRPRSGWGTALWWGAGGWSTGRAADTVSARRWAGGQTARSPGTHSEPGLRQSLNPLIGTAACKSPPCAPPTCKSATNTTHKQPLGGDLEGRRLPLHNYIL